MSQGGGDSFQKTFIKKCVDISSVLFSFLEAALKPGSTATVAEIKQLCRENLNAVHEMHVQL